ncbi:acetyltransferase [Mycena metata]|uniref:Acetyltransferase n=1 Tax=Mycena metata TaxID=1033252 RepID=A0AAD7KF58_9AGAR|nr:acetyltransferase [Mycena metata]
MHSRSARLTLREFTLADVPAMYALESIPEVARYQTWPPRTLEKAEETVQAAIAEAEEVPRVVIEQAVLITLQLEDNLKTAAADVFIGRAGGRIDADARTAEVWFEFMPSAGGRGYATEATGALIRMLREAAESGEVPPFDSVIIECDPRNERSRKLAERLGFVMESCTERAFECKGEWVGSMVYTQRLVQ